MQQSESQSSGNRVLAWAIEKATGLARHVSEVATGRACNCICPACGHGLLGVNAGRRDLRLGQRRPHFRHEQGVEKHQCLVLAGREALRRTLHSEGVFQLPARRMEGNYQGASGLLHRYTVLAPAERVHIKRIEYDDEAIGVLVLDDGRKIRVVMRGSLHPIEPGDSQAVISIDMDPGEAAQLTPNEIRSRLFLDTNSLDWVCHWRDAELRAEADAGAQARAVDAADWLPETLADVPEEWRRESALHLAVKAIIEESRCMVLPPLGLLVKRERYPVSVQLTWSDDAKEVQFDDVSLEHRLGRIVPDVVATVGRHTLLIEVVVSHPVDDQKLGLIRQLNIACLEINLSRSHGQVTLEELREIVLGASAAKRWLHHPRLERMREKLEGEADSELDRKVTEHVEAMRRHVAEARDATFKQILARTTSKGSAAEQYARASGRDAKRFRPVPSQDEVSPFLSGRALEEWRRSNPERYEDLKASGFFKRLGKPGTGSGDGSG